MKLAGRGRNAVQSLVSAFPGFLSVELPFMPWKSDFSGAFYEANRKGDT